MTRSLKARIIMIAFFIGVNVILGMYFLLNVKGQSLVPEPVKQVFSRYGLVKEDQSSFPLSTSPDYSVRIDLDSDAVITAINEQRESNKQQPVSNSAKLHEAAEIVMEKIKADNYELNQENGNDLLEDALKEVGYHYSSAYQSIVIGPVTSASVVEYWFNNNQKETVLASDVSEIGVATTVESLHSEFSGITVVLLAKPRGVTAIQPQQSKQPSKPTLPPISDQEVTTALNNYRAAHGVPALNVDENLCSYAQKRVGDLVAFGGLDNHKGFQSDFADPENPPEPIKKYAGSKIGENLAHQFCRNMTTGDSFVAETGTAIIEWCFDSSTKGHREAQLSTEFRNVCVRHADGMYVVIFGD